jgi:hypothetical protein
MPSPHAKRGNPHYPRWTDAKTGKEPTLKLLQKAGMPKKPHAGRKRKG